MPEARHRIARRRSPRLRLLGVACVGALAFVSLAAGGPASNGPTAEPAWVFDVAEGSVPDVIDGRDDAIAGRSQTREASPAPEPSYAVVEGPDAPLPEVTGQLWASTAVNVRSGPSVEHEQLTTLAWADQVDVTGETSDGWTQVIWDEHVAWVASDFLVEEEPVAPEPEPEPAEESEPVDQGVSAAACATSPGIESSLAANAVATYRAVCAAFPGAVSAYGGYRAGDGGDHGSGHALDIMVSGAAGWDIASYLQAHASELGITYLIYEQQMWMAGDSAGAWEYMEDRGSPTANHYDHVHVSTY